MAGCVRVAGEQLALLQQVSLTQLVLVVLPPPTQCLRTRPLSYVLIFVSTVEAYQGWIPVKNLIILHEIVRMTYDIV